MKTLLCRHYADIKKAIRLTLAINATQSSIIIDLVLVFPAIDDIYFVVILMMLSCSWSQKHVTIYLLLQILKSQIVLVAAFPIGSAAFIVAMTCALFTNDRSHAVFGYYVEGPVAHGTWHGPASMAPPPGPASVTMAQQ